jgi:hypothetical protein
VAQQTPEEMLLVLMNAMGKGPTDKLTTAEELKKAAKRVGEKKESRLKWALKFANTDLASMTPGDWFNCQLELTAFRTPVIPSFLRSNEQFPVTPLGGFFPDFKQIREIHDEFNRLLDNYVSTGHMTVAFEGKASFSVAEDAEGNRVFTFTVHDYAIDCLIKLMQLAGDFADLVRICPEKKHVARNWFLATRSDNVFCSKTCVSNSTSRARRARLKKAKTLQKRRTA